MRLCAFSGLPKSANNFLGKSSRLMSEGAGTTLGAAAIVIIVTVICHLGPKGFVRDQTNVWSFTAFVCFADDKSRTIQGHSIKKVSQYVQPIRGLAEERLR